MSFSFTASGTPKEAIAQVGQAAASQQAPKGFVDSLNDQLSGLPDNCEVTVSAHGHTDRNQSQLSGNFTFHGQIDWRLGATRPVQEVVDTDPEVQPGPERFPEGFTEDAPPGPAAGEQAA